jgi:hypothetical protein
MALLNCAFRLLFKRIFHIVTAITGFYTAWVTSGKSPSEYMFSELPQVADIVRSPFHHLASPLVLGATEIRHAELLDE